jgi:fumarate reductase subunit D
VNVGRLLISAGFGLIALGALVLLLNQMNLPLGRLPGDIVYRGRNTTFYFPWVTCLLLSVLGTLVLWLLNRRQ